MSRFDHNKRNAHLKLKVIHSRPSIRRKNVSQTKVLIEQVYRSQWEKKMLCFSGVSASST